MPNLTTIVSVAGASFAASFVEAVEALTVVLAVGLARGWRPALTGAAAALAALALIVVALGPLLSIVPIRALQLGVGLLLLLFGLRWLRKAILRAIGIIALHDEDAAFQRGTRELSEADGRDAHGFDWLGGMTAFKIVLLEGIEVAFIVIAVGAGRGLYRGRGHRRGSPSASLARPRKCAQIRGWRHAFGLRSVLDRRKPWRRLAGRRRGHSRLCRPVPGRGLGPGRPSQAKSGGARVISPVVKELIGLFVDDELLAATILCAVALISALALSGVAPGWLVGLMLILALPATLVASVLRSASRKKRSE
jgi:hypothetical protein